MPTWHDDFTVDHFADATYSPYAFPPPTISGGHCLCTTNAWFDTRENSHVLSTTLRVLADSQIYLIALGVSDPTLASDFVIVELVVPSAFWEVAVAHGGAVAGAAAGAFAVPPGDWDLTVSVDSAGHVAASAGAQALSLDMTTGQLADWNAAPTVHPVVLAYSMVALGVAGAVDDFDFWEYSGAGGGPPPPPPTPPSIEVGQHYTGIVRRPLRPLL